MQVGDDTHHRQERHPRHRLLLALAARPRDRRPRHHLASRPSSSTSCPRRSPCSAAASSASSSRASGSRCGAEVTIIEALPHLVPNEDESISKQFERAFRKRGIEFKLGVRFQGVTQNDNGVVVTLENGETIEAELLLVAVGRGPVDRRTSASRRSASPWTAASSSPTSASRTNIPGVYAVGDIVPGLQLAHRGFQQGIFVAEEIAGLNPIVVEDVNIPKVTYCDPEVASVGLTEAKAEEKYGADAGHVSYDYNLAGNGKSHILGTSRLDQGRPRRTTAPSSACT